MIYTFQALSEEDRGMWLDAMDGKEPMYVHAPKPSNAHQTFLDEGGFLFIQRCFNCISKKILSEFVLRISSSHVCRFLFF